MVVDKPSPSIVTLTGYNSTGSATVDTSFGDGKDRWIIEALALVER